MTIDRAIRDAMVAAIPRLRRFAVALADAQQADDLVQDTLLLACDKIRLFDGRSEMLPWLITILRNQFYSERRKRRREIEDVDGASAERLTTGPTQIAHAEHAELQAALLKLLRETREALQPSVTQAFHTRKQRKPAAVPSAPFAAACIALANLWPRSWASKVPPILRCLVFDVDLSGNNPQRTRGHHARIDYGFPSTGAIPSPTGT